MFIVSDAITSASFKMHRLLWLECFEQENKEI